MSTTTKKAAAIKLRDAYVKGARKTFGIKPRQNYGRSAYVHTLPAAAKIVRIGEDEIAVTDGGGGYTPFRISTLRDMLHQASKLPIATEFRCDE